MPKAEKVCQKLRKYDKSHKVWDSVPKVVEVWESLFAKSWESMRKSAKSWERTNSVQKCAKSWESMTKCDKSWESITYGTKS